MSVFDGTQREIGRGAQAVVYYYNGFAYKAYSGQYPKEWIRYEFTIQKEIIKTGLPVIKYYETEEFNILKMDYINGMTLADRIRKEKYKNGVEDLIRVQKEVHKFRNVKIPSFKKQALNDINQLQVEQEKKDKALEYLAEIEEKNNLLHLDFHFLNIMYAGEKYYIIDWINAKIGNPIYDYARSYVIMNEFAYRLSIKYLSLITKDKEIDSTDFKKAIYVMSLLRLRENSSVKTLELVNKIENELI